MEQLINAMQKALEEDEMHGVGRSWAMGDKISIPPFDSFQDMCDQIRSYDDECLLELFEWFQHFEDKKYPNWLANVYGETLKALCVKGNYNCTYPNFIYRDDQVILVNRMLDIAYKVRNGMPYEFKESYLSFSDCLSEEAQTDIIPRLLKEDTPEVRRFVSSSYYFYPKKYKNEIMSYLKELSLGSLYMRMLCYYPYHDVIPLYQGICSSLSYSELIYLLSLRFKNVWDKEEEKNDLCIKMLYPCTEQEWLFIAGRKIDEVLQLNYYNRRNNNVCLYVTCVDEEKIYRKYSFDYYDYITTSIYSDGFSDVDDWMNNGGVEVSESSYWKYEEAFGENARDGYVVQKVIELMNKYLYILKDIPNMTSQEEERYSNLSNAVVCNKVYLSNVVVCNRPYGNSKKI